MPFTISVDGGFAAGRMDLWPGSVDDPIVDYKTDLVSAAKAAEHATEHFSAQAQSYIEGLRDATGIEAGSVVFVYCRPGVD